jgi:hypothetical protein
MASASRESVFGVQTSTARKNHRSGHSEMRAIPFVVWLRPVGEHERVSEHNAVVWKVV